MKQFVSGIAGYRPVLKPEVDILSSSSEYNLGGGSVLKELTNCFFKLPYCCRLLIDGLDEAPLQYKL